MALISLKGKPKVQYLASPHSGCCYLFGLKSHYSFPSLPSSASLSNLLEVCISFRDYILTVPFVWAIQLLDLSVAASLLSSDTFCVVTPLALQSCSLPHGLPTIFFPATNDPAVYLGSENIMLMKRKAGMEYYMECQMSVIQVSIRSDSSWLLGQ